MAAEIPFPVYHGMSTHYASLFRHGVPTDAWPYRDAALAFVRETATALQQAGHELEWYEARVLEQSSHWQHGRIYVSPSQSTAARYAYSTAAHGGELVNIGIEMLRRFRETHAQRANLILAKHQNALPMLSGLGRPLVLEISHLSVTSVVPERADQKCGKAIDTVIGYWQNESPEMFEALSQQSNFQLLPGAGKITRIFEVISDDGDQKFELCPVDWNDV